MVLPPRSSTMPPVRSTGNVTEFKLGIGVKTINAHDAKTERLTRIWTTRDHIGYPGQSL